MIKEFFDYCMVASVLIGVVFIISILLSKRGRDKSIIYLNLLVLFFILNNLQRLLIDAVFTAAPFFIGNLLIPFYALIVPSFYTFITHYLSIQKKTTSFVVLALGLFFAEVIARLFIFECCPGQNFFIAKYAQIEEIINALFSLFLFFKAGLLVFNRSRLYQHVLEFDNVKWIKTFLFIGSIILLTWICAIILNLNKVINPQIFIYYPLRLSSAVLLFWLGYQGFFNYNLMSERIQLRSLITNEIQQNSIQFKDEAVKSDKFLMVKEYVEGNYKYLDAHFSLEILSADLKMSSSSLSQIINSGSGYNFSDYINSLRVEKSKIGLVSVEYNDYTILSIGLECGFNSKSTFYSAFKKFTKLTPSAYRRNNS